MLPCTTKECHTEVGSTLQPLVAHALAGSITCMMSHQKVTRMMVWRETSAEIHVEVVMARGAILHQKMMVLKSGVIVQCQSAVSG